MHSANIAALTPQVFTLQLNVFRIISSALTPRRINMQATCGRNNDQEDNNGTVLRGEVEVLILLPHHQGSLTCYESRGPLIPSVSVCVFPCITFSLYTISNVPAPVDSYVCR